MADPTSKTVTVGKRTFDLILPRSFTIRREIVLAASKNPDRGFAAALGVCWQTVGRPKSRYHASYQPLLYGAQVLDELTDRGEDPSEVLNAGFKAWDLLRESFVSEEEVVKAEIPLDQQTEG